MEQTQGRKDTILTKKYVNMVKYPLFAWDLKLRKYHREVIWHTIAKVGKQVFFTIYFDDGYRKWRINIPMGIVAWELKELKKRGYTPKLSKEQRNRGIYNFDAVTKTNSPE